MKAIILAAGRGTRLYPYTQYIPKCLLDIGGVTILEHQLNHIRDCGISEVVIVVGFGFEKVENFLRNFDSLGMRIKTLYNPFYRTTNSLISLWIARGEMDDDIIVMNGDDVFEIDVIDKAIAVSNEKICMPVKRKSSYDDEDMKVRLDKEKIVDISKCIKNNVSAESVGLRVFRDTGVEIIKRAIEEEMRTPVAGRKWYISSIQRLINKGYKIKSLDIGNLFWMDVDYPVDLFKVRANSDKFLNVERNQIYLRVVESNQ